jgi:transposase
MSRQTKLTPKVQEIIVSAIAAGNYAETAAQAAGIGKTTLYRWLEQAEDENADQIYRDFRDAVEKAKAEAEERDLKVITQAAHDGSWQAAAWKLERRTPHKWGRVNRTEISGPEGKPVEVRTSVEAILEALGVDDADTQD